MLIGYTIIFVSFYACHVAEGTVIEIHEYTFGEDCPRSEEVNEYRQIHLEYEGQRVSSCSYMSFQGQGKKISDDYQVCVIKKWFVDGDCSMEIVFRSGYEGKKLKSFTCSSSYSNTEFCADSGEKLYVYFKSRNGKSTSSVSFRFLITATKLDYSNLVWAVIGGVIGGIVLVTLLTALFCWCVCKRKSASGRVLTKPDKLQQVQL
ncbi:uncharacterized protein LOC133176873 [Saccostrea echinata]|uniref:uncharacterized protein LOC133176873 n=1 Tax=Saccostrea echinata TaxID=191078 RepID=UPI002A8156C6|nr:uncharacterized protein LOC133176873 [Saccostrea echinata]